MSDHVSIERMNEALDGDVPSSEMEAIEAHLIECAPCRNEHARLSEVVRAVRALPRAASAPEEAWAGIANRIGSAEREAGPQVTVLPLPVGRSSEGEPRERDQRTFVGRRVSLSVAQLAVAAALVALISAMTVWIAFDQGTRGTVASAGPPALAGAAARAVSTDANRYAEVVDQLERILEEGRMVLAPETLVTIEESLQTLDAAIADIEVALAEDPGSDLLMRMLANHQKTKLGVLQRAAAAVQAQT